MLTEYQRRQIAEIFFDFTEPKHEIFIDDLLDKIESILNEPNSEFDLPGEHGNHNDCRCHYASA